VLMRRLDDRFGAAPSAHERWLWAPLVPAACLAIFAAAADYNLARAGRQAAELVRTTLSSPDHTVWFSGHWGFQYYLEQYGARPYDVNKFEAQPGDHLIVPRNNTNTLLPHAPQVRLETPLEIRVLPGAATMSLQAGAGFYDSGCGPVPFIAGPTPAEVYDVVGFTEPVRSRRAASQTH